MKVTNKNTYVNSDAEAKVIVGIILNYLEIFMPIMNSGLSDIAKTQ